MPTLPQSVGLDTEIRYTDYPTNTFIIDWNSRQIKGMDAGLAAMRQAIEIILACERFKWQIYSSNFGSELEELPGESFAFLEAEIPRRIKDAFSADKRILDTQNWAFQNNGDGSMSVFFDVITVFGTVSEEVTV